MTEPELQKKLDCWSGDHSAEYAALLNDLAQLKLLKVLLDHTFQAGQSSIMSGLFVYHDRRMQGDTSEAQKLFQSALLVGQKPTQEVQSPEEAEEDWESSE